MFHPLKSLRSAARVALSVICALALVPMLLVANAPARAAALTDYAETALIGHIFRGTAFPMPGTVYIALHTTACSDAATGTEVTGGAYARVGVAATGAQWAATAGGNGTTSNLNVITFPTPASGWGTVTHFSIFDAASAGNQLICQGLTTSKTINSGDGVSFAAGSLTFQIDN